MLVVAGGCGASRREICPPAERTLLLRAPLLPRTPSAPFTVPAGGTVWIQTTRTPASYDQNQPFGRTGIEVHLLAADAAPDLARDRSVVMRGPRRWVAVDLAAGAWRVYSLRDPAVELVVCP